jgi:predicted porin
MEGKVSYSWTGDVAGKVWASAMSYDRQHISASSSVTADTVTYRNDSDTTTGWDIGAAITSGNLGLVAYYYETEGAGHTLNALSGGEGFFTSGAGSIKARDGDGGYVQATYVIPSGTKLGVAYGVNNMDRASGEVN